ncbi:MAG TPA: glycosyltransferase, partial [Nitrospirae bacterium]|nr:glycosyltransferase [Nitrospirota bacterium]
YVFYQSEFCRESADKYLGAVDCPWEIAYNYVDTGVFTPPEKNQSFGEWRLLCAGNNLRRYRVTSALDTVAELKKRGCKVHITIAGGLLWPGSDDPYKDIMEYMKLLGIEREAKIQLTYTREEASDIYSNAHLLLHTKYNDPCPNVVIEAMSCGLPVVGSNSGGMPELVAPGAGILVDVPMDWEKDHAPEVTQLADAVEKIMNQRDRYSQNARELAIRRFDKAIWLNQHKRVFEDILNVD